MAKSPLMADLYGCHIDTSWELLEDDEGRTTVPCGHSLYTSPKADLRGVLPPSQRGRERLRMAGAVPAGGS